MGQPQLNVPERKSHPRGKPLQTRFPKYHELFEEPHRRRAADDSLAAKAASTQNKYICVGVVVVTCLGLVGVVVVTCLGLVDVVPG